MENPLSFSVTRIKEEGRVGFRGSVEAARFDEPLSEQSRLTSPVGVELEATWRDGCVWLNGRVSGEMESACCRCLNPARSTYSAKVEGSIEHPGDRVDATDELRQTLLLAVPIQPYCKPGCLGLCAQCGQDKNVRDCGCAPPSRFKLIKRGKLDA